MKARIADLSERVRVCPARTQYAIDKMQTAVETATTQTKMQKMQTAVETATTQTKSASAD